MCNLSDGIEVRGIERGRREGMKEGVKEGILTSITSLMETMGWTAKQAMNALKIPADEQSVYAGMMKK